MPRIVNLTVPRIYLDTNILISAIFESDSSWQTQSDRRDLIETSKAILEKWEPSRMMTSPYAVGEFMSKGLLKFRKSYAEIVNIVSSQILSKCNVLYTVLSNKTIPKLDERWKENWILASRRFYAKRSIDWDEKILLFDNGEATTSMHTGQSEENMVAEPSQTHNISAGFDKVEYRCPGFEIMMFQKAAEYAEKYGCHFSDALHFMYVDRNEVDIIVTNDRKFALRWNTLPNNITGGISILSSTDLLNKYQNKLHS